MTTRRSFISSLLLGSVAPLFLPGASRIWKPNPKIVTGEFFSFPIGVSPNRLILNGYYLRITEDGKNLEWFNSEGNTISYKEKIITADFMEDLCHKLKLESDESLFLKETS